MQNINSKIINKKCVTIYIYYKIHKLGINCIRDYIINFVYTLPNLINRLNIF